MNRNRIVLLAGTLALLAALPASAYNSSADCRGAITWNSSTITWRPSLISFPQGSGWYNSIDAARVAWNSYTPGTNYRINYIWDTNFSASNNDGRNSILTPDVWVDDPRYLAVTHMRWSGCWPWPGPRSDYQEGDIVFNRNYSWENSLNPVAPYGPPYNSTLVAMHEEGHGLGLGHENDFPATMNATYPDGGPIGNGANVHPHADDVRGDRALYGTAASLRDFDSYAYRLITPPLTDYPGATEPIPPPSYVNRNTQVSFQFSVENRGTSDQSSVAVYFYLAPTRNGVTTSSFYLGSATLSIGAGRTVTPWATVTIPSYAPTGYQYIGWIIDPTNAIAETDETNNGVTMTASTYVSTNNAPTACFSATPVSGPAPLLVSFNAGCSSDPDGNPLTFTWDFGDGSTGSGVTATHYYSPGSYDATLTVTDSNGAVAYSYRSIFASGGDCYPQLVCDPAM